ncbi:MAG: tetratricopeptide repeat protein [Myxococcaceae bacterium]|nr:tetratricopeptide repeat protein [Myxococcaceae bacterium]
MDKNKVIEAAAKLVAKGAYDKAIKEYQKILDADPKDVRILQKMGELYQKKNDNAQAAHYFTKVAENYASDGFFLKAVALYKQVLKLDPSLIDVNLKLAELHQQLQLMSEAMAYYQVVANHYDKAGDTRASLDTLKKMVDLDPDNIASRIKLAELYARENMNDEALGEFRRAAEHLKRNNRIDDYLRVAERISGLEPQNFQLARELADVYLSRGDQKRALAKLQVCFKADSRDVETLKLLAVAFQGLGQTSKTISVYKELARVYADKGRREDSESIWRQVEALDPNDADVQARRPAAPVPVAPARPSTGVQAAARPPPAAASAPASSHAMSFGGAPSSTATAQQPAFSPQSRTAQSPAFVPSAPAAPAPAQAAPAGGPKESLGKLLTETDVYVKYGLHDKALEHLRKVFNVDPENIDAHEKAYAIYVASNNHGQASEQLLNVLRLHTRRGDSARAQPYLQTILQSNPSHPEVPVFLAALKSGAPAGSGAAAEQELPDDAILVDSSDEEIIVADAPEDALAGGDSFAESSDDDVALRAAEDLGSELVTDDPIAMEPDAADEAARFEVEPPPVMDDQPEEQAVVSDAFDDASMQEDASMQDAGLEAAAADSYADPVTGEREMVIEEPTTSTTELPADDAYSLGGGRESYEVTGEMPAYQPQAAYEKEAAYEEEPVEAPPELGGDEEPMSTSQSAALVTEVPPEEGVEEEAVEAPPEEELPAQEECDEATFFMEQSLFDEASEILETVLIAYPGHARATELMAKLEALRSGAGANGVATDQTPAYDNGESAGYSNGADDPPTGERDAFDLAAELASELGDAESSPDLPSGEVPSADYQVSVEEVFSEFKKGLEKVVKPEDVDTHYDLGIAYKEMGLLDDAIGEFTVARQGCLGKKKEIDCLAMQAALQGMKGDFSAAVEALKTALGSEHATGETEKAVRYELGSMYEQAGEQGKALAQFMKVSDLDGAYRDVAGMVERLSQVASPEEDDPPPPPRGSAGGKGKAGSRKVGYL